ncbi:hypothetical protein PMAYCL1PPCAC_13809, partial [Pristionchus mayeri]
DSITSSEIKEEVVEIKDEPFDDFPEIKLELPIADVSQIDTSNEIKEEEVEIKDEPVDEFADIKQEEPIVDMYCPSTGISRPLEQSTTIISSKSASKAIHLKCVVCQKVRNDSDMRQFTHDKKKRSQWVNALRSTPDGRRELMEVLNSWKNPYLCAGHFSPSDFYHYENRVFLRPNAIPSFENMESENEEEPFVKKLRMESVPKPMTMDRRKCVVCHLIRNRKEMHVFITEKKRRSRWVNAVRSTPEGRRILMEQLNTTIKSFLCASHFSPLDYYYTGGTKVLRFDAMLSFEVRCMHPQEP